MSSLFNIGLSGFTAATNAMRLTANNIANAHNPFYSRRSVNFLESNPTRFGTGITLGDVKRINDTLLSKQLLTANSEFSKSSLLYNNLKNLETLLDDDETSVSKFFSESLSAIEALNVNPSSYQGRNYYLDSLRNLSNRINAVGQKLNLERTSSQNSLNQKINQVNSLLSKLDDVNQKIKVSNSENKLNLLDQKDELLTSLGELISVQVKENDFGGVEITLNNGTSLLDASYIATLTTQSQRSTPEHQEVFVQNGTDLIAVTDFITSGEISGLLDYSNNTLTLLERKLNKLAAVFSYTMNQQNRLGIDSQGNLGGMIFNDVNDLLLAQRRVVAGLDNQGNAQMNVLINEPNKLVESDYQLIIDTPNHYNLIRLSDGNQVSSGSLAAIPAQIAVDGFSINITNANLNVGDSYTINPTKDLALKLQVRAKEGSELALGFPVTASANLQNIGKGTINVSAITDTANNAFALAKQLNPPLKIVFLSESSYRLVNANDNTILEDNIPYNATQGSTVFPTPNGYDPGYRVTLAGEMRATDSFSIEYNTNGESDNRNGLLFSELFLKGTINGDKLTYTQAYQDFMFQISMLTNESFINQNVAGNFQTQLQTMHDENSGVSYEQEEINLSMLQEFFLANAQVLEAAKLTMDSIFSLFRR